MSAHAMTDAAWLLIGLLAFVAVGWFVARDDQRDDDEGDDR
jgi:hypothetical protein